MPVTLLYTVFGTSASNKTAKSVNTVRTVDIFVSRLDPLTTDGELIECINAAKGDLAVAEVKCTRLQSKYEELYSSYHVAVTVISVQFKAATELFSSADMWPLGAFVRRFFKQRHGGGNSDERVGI